MAKKIVSYADKSYQERKSIFDVLAQCMDELKYGEVHTARAWNMLVEEINGVTISFVGEGNVQLIYHRYQTGTVEEIAKSKVDDDGQKFLKEVVKELKKKFKSKTGKALTMKEQQTDRYIDKVSRLAAETSWVMGYNSRPVGRFLIRDVAFYDCFTYFFFISIYLSCIN